MNIRGYSKTSLIDFPGRISSIVFTGGCNFRCGYCYNPDIVKGNSELPQIDTAEIFSHLKKRINVLDGVVITGGEPTLDPGLINFCREIRDIGFKIKIDTNGTNPAVIAEIIKSGLADYIAVDIKTSPSKYKELVSAEVDPDLVLSTIDILKKTGVDYEIRTTCVPGFMSENDALEICGWIGRVKNYYLQQFVPSTALIDESFRKKNPFTKEYLYSILDVISAYADNCAVRGL